MGEGGRGGEHRRNYLGLTHPPDIASLHVVAEYFLTSTAADNHLPNTSLSKTATAYLASLRYLERLVMTPVLLRLLGHQPHVASVTHGRPIELTVGPAV